MLKKCIVLLVVCLPLIVLGCAKAANASSDVIYGYQKMELRMDISADSHQMVITTQATVALGGDAWSTSSLAINEEINFNTTNSNNGFVEVRKAKTIDAANGRVYHNPVIKIPNTTQHTHQLIA